MKPFDTDKMPWLFTPHGDGELNEYFSTDHSKIIADTSKQVLASLSESRDRLSGKLCYEFHYNQRRYKYTLLRFADLIVRADVSIKKLKKRIMELDIDNRELRKQLADMEKEDETMNTPKFDLGAMLSAPQTAIQQIPCDQLHPYHNHKFELYSGERLEDMVASIKENGVLSPIIVQPIEDGYEILIGHNRWNASKLAGLPTVPAIVKAGLTEDEAEMYVIESNLIQRSFSDLKISEQAAVVASRHSKMFSPGKRNDIIRELTLLENPNAEISGDTTLNPVGSKLDTSESVGKEYGVSKGSVVRLIRINKLIDELKALVDSGELSIRAGVELSFLSEDTQAVVAECAEDCKLT